MRTQLQKTIENTEMAIKTAGYDLRNTVCLNIYTTSTAELFANMDILQRWLTQNEIKQSSTVLEVKSLFDTLKVELEATVVK